MEKKYERIRCWNESHMIRNIARIKKQFIYIKWKFDVIFLHSHTHTHITYNSKVALINFLCLLERNILEKKDDENDNDDDDMNTRMLKLFFIIIKIENILINKKKSIYKDNFHTMKMSQEEKKFKFKF